MALELDEQQRARLDAEWAFLNATREMMNIARRKPDSTTYNQAIYFGVAIAPSIMGPERRLLHGIKESNEAKLFREKALAETELRQRFVTGHDVLEEEIAALTSQVSAVPDAEMLQNRLAILKKVLQELKPKKVSENQIIFRDAVKTNRHLPITGMGTDTVPLRTPLRKLPRCKRAYCSQAKRGLRLEHLQECSCRRRCHQPARSRLLAVALPFQRRLGAANPSRPTERAVSRCLGWQ
jgi:hypothetical protein